jgi:type IV pilus assembly protein PilM
MPQTTIGLDIGTTSIKVAKLETSVFRYEFVDFAEHPLPANVELPWEQLVASVLQVVFAERGVRPDKVIASIPGRYVSARLLQFPFSDRKKIAQTIPFEIEGLIPFGLESILLDYEVIESGPQGSWVMALFTEKALLEKHLALLREAGLDPQAVIPAPVALANLWKEISPTDPSPYAIVDLGESETSLCVVHQRSLRFSRTWAFGSSILTRALADGLGMTPAQARDVKEQRADLLAPLTSDKDSVPTSVALVLRKALGPVVGGIRQSLLGALKTSHGPVKRLYLCGKGSRLKGFRECLAEELRLEVVPLELSGQIGSALRQKEIDPAAAAVSLGLALHGVRETWASRINLRTGEYTFVSERAELKRQLTSAGVMAGVLLAMLLTLLGFQYHSRSSEYRRVSASMEKTALELFPELASIPAGERRLFAMTQRLDQEKREMELFAPLSPDGLSVLNILRGISQAAPEDVKIDVRELQIEEAKVRIEGETDSYNSAEQIKSNLLSSGIFASADNPEYKPSLDQSKVKFVMTLQLAQKVF